MKPLWRCHAFAATVCIAIVAPIAYPLFDRQLPFEREGGYIMPPEPAPGDVVNVRWYGKRHRECPGRISRKVVDAQGKIHQLADVTSDLAVSRPTNDLTRQFILPNAVAEGPALYYATSYFVCNWTQEWWPITGEVAPLPFTVKLR